MSRNSNRGNTAVSKTLALLFFSSLFLALAFPVSSRAQASGSTKWVVAKSPEVGGSGGASAVAIDSQGNVYATGAELINPAGHPTYCPPPESCAQALTIKYSPVGKVLWEDSLSTTIPGTAQGMNVAVDSAGNAYVLFNSTHHRSSDGVTIPEIVTAKYNPTGGRDWINFIDSSHAVGGTLSTPVQMAVSAAGNVYVLYDVASPTVADTAVTVKYDTAGHFIWSQTINDAPPNRPFGFGIDANENVYVQVELSELTGANGEIVKYNADGVRLASFGRGQISVALSFHVDPDGACYLSGYGATSANVQPDLVVAKFNPNQSLAYLTDITKLESIGGPLGPPMGPDSLIGQIASDSAGDAFVLQQFDQTGPHGDGEVISVLKLNTSGKEVFVTRYNNASDESGFASPTALAVSPSGDFYITGSAAPESVNTPEFVTVKYDSAGVQQWVTQYPGSGQFARPGAMALSGNSLVVTGASAISNGGNSEWATISYFP